MAFFHLIIKTNSFASCSTYSTAKGAIVLTLKQNHLRLDWTDFQHGYRIFAHMLTAKPGAVRCKTMSICLPFIKTLPSKKYTSFHEF